MCLTLPAAFGPNTQYALLHINGAGFTLLAQFIAGSHLVINCRQQHDASCPSCMLCSCSENSAAGSAKQHIRLRLSLIPSTPH